MTTLKKLLLILLNCTLSSSFSGNHVGEAANDEHISNVKRKSFQVLCDSELPLPLPLSPGNDPEDSYYNLYSDFFSNNKKISFSPLFDQEDTDRLLHPAGRNSPSHESTSAHLYGSADVPSDLVQPETHESPVVFSNHHATIPVRQSVNDQNKEKMNHSFDVWGIPLLPYYGIHILNYPLEVRKDNNQMIYEVIRTAIEKSNFQYHVQLPVMLNFDESLITRENGTELVPEHGFLSRLCLRNMAFLLSVCPKPDCVVENEIIEMLNRLHTRVYSLLRHSDIGETVNLYLPTEYTYIPHVSIKRPKSYKQRNSEVSEFEAQEWWIILIILGNYYKSTQPAKWKMLFPEDTLFLKYYLRFVMIEANHKKAEHTEWHWSYMEEINLLPWSDNGSSRINFQRQKTLFFNADSISTLIKSRVNQNQESWKELLKFETESAPGIWLQGRLPLSRISSYK